MEYPALRVTHRKAHGNRSPRFLARCGCGCENRIEVYYPDVGTEDFCDATLEIGGVIASVESWRSLLIPLLEIGIDENK